MMDSLLGRIGRFLRVVDFQFNVARANRSCFDCLTNTYSSDLFGVTRVPRASGRTRTLRDHVINETPPNRVYRVYRSTAALHPSYLANICRDREGGSIPTKLVRSLLLSICLYVHTYMYVCVCVSKVCAIVSYIDGNSIDCACALYE